jgi:hypothetical protein
MDIGVRRTGAEETNHRQSRVLRSRCKRPRHCRPADQRDELASPHIGPQAQERALYSLKQVL